MVAKLLEITKKNSKIGVTIQPVIPYYLTFTWQALCPDKWHTCKKLPESPRYLELHILVANRNNREFT